MSKKYPKKSMAHVIDIKGQQFKTWIVKNFKGVVKTFAQWECECQHCHRTKITTGVQWRAKTVGKCVCQSPVRENSIGQVFGRLTILEEELKPYGKNGKKDYVCLCKCQCGNNEFWVRKRSLTGGTTRSCGCLIHVKRQTDTMTAHKDSRGYIEIYYPSHPNAKKNNTIGEHTLVLSNFLGRPLEKGEFVHHKNGVRHDNRIENLELWTKSHPNGQRVVNLIEHAHYILDKYKDYKDPI